MVVIIKKKYIGFCKKKTKIPELWQKKCLFFFSSPILIKLIALQFCQEEPF